nr:uncharacterized protein LOC129490290 isoform X2 [Symphalangus syndactylus]
MRGAAGHAWAGILKERFPQTWKAADRSPDPMIVLPMGKQGSRGEGRVPKFPQRRLWQSLGLSAPSQGPFQALAAICCTSTRKHGSRLLEGLVLRHQRQTVLTDGLFSFHVEGVRKKNARQNSCTHPGAQPPAVHSRCPFACTEDGELTTYGARPFCLWRALLRLPNHTSAGMLPPGEPKPVLQWLAVVTVRKTWIPRGLSISVVYFCSCKVIHFKCDFINPFQA